MEPIAALLATGLPGVQFAKQSSHFRYVMIDRTYASDMFIVVWLSARSRVAGLLGFSSCIAKNHAHLMNSHIIC